MTNDELILDRYEPLGTAGEGGFGTVQIAWDPRIQRKVAIKTIRLTALDAVRAALPGAQAVAGASTADRWHGIQPWGEFVAEDGAAEDAPLPPDPAIPSLASDGSSAPEDGASNAPDRSSSNDEARSGLPKAPSPKPARAGADQVTALAHLPGLDEARTAAMLADSRIVTVYDFEVRGRIAYLIMEYVEGITLADLLANYGEYLTLDMVAAVFSSVAGALEVAHGAGVLHLDIKPDNILINAQGKVKVTDFGLATLADASGAGKTGGGTVGYMPPEQIRREPLDARADEWSLAAVAYEMLTGSNSFRVQGLENAETAINDAELVLPSLCWKNIDEQIDDVVFYALDPDRERRYASVADFAEEAGKFLGDAATGVAQLQLVVEDALGIEEEAPVPEAAVGYDADSPGGLAVVPRRSFTERFVDLVSAKGDEDVDEPLETDDAVLEAPVRSENAKPAREPLKSRVPDGVLFVFSHAFGAVASGLLTILALANMQPLSVLLGPGGPYAVAAIAALVAVAGAIRSHVGALVSFSLLGVSIVMSGHPIVGAAVLIATVGWWYTVGHVGSASANVALLAPLAGAVGGTTMVPFFSGVSMRPVQALATTVFAVIIAVVMGGFGSQSLLDWGAIAHWDFARADISGAIVRMLGQPATWATIGGWLGATAVLSLLKLRESKVLVIVGIALALAAVLLGSLALSAPTPQLIISVIVACSALLTVL